MAAARRFGARWWQYATIPLFAGAVGWVTNKVAVEMIFRPLDFWGVPLRRYPNQPLGWIGWQGIVPCKAGVMAGRLTDIVTTKLLDVREVFGRISPARFSELLATEAEYVSDLRTMVSVFGRPAQKLSIRATSSCESAQLCRNRLGTRARGGSRHVGK